MHTLAGRWSRRKKTQIGGRVSARSLVYILASVSAPASATVIYVTPGGSGDAATIRAAINLAADGDTIELASGIYVGPDNRDLDLSGRSLLIRSESGDPTTCIIDCEGSVGQPHSGFYAESGPGVSTLEGLTITGAYVSGGVPAGSAVTSDGMTTIHVRNCRIVGNSGSAIVCGQTLATNIPTIDGCLIAGNMGTTTGGGWDSGLVPCDCSKLDNRRESRDRRGRNPGGAGDRIDTHENRAVGELCDVI